MLEDIYESFNKTKDQNQNQFYDEKKKLGYNNTRKITDQIRGIDKKMDEHEQEIDKDYTEK